MANMFRLLRADEIDVRIGTAKSGGKGVTLLLYKDARCDQNILDETVGPMNWQRTHSRDNANCIVSLWDEKKGQWISKEDTGTESKTEAEKGLASDSFKRACVNWGIGRELYSAPLIWVSGDPDNLKWERYTVLDIGYDKSQEISKLAIGDKNGNVVFRYGNTTVKAAPIKKEPLPDDAVEPGEKMKPEWNVRIARDKFCQYEKITAEDYSRIRVALIKVNKLANKTLDELEPVDFDNECKMIKDTIPLYRKHMGEQK